MDVSSGLDYFPLCFSKYAASPIKALYTAGYAARGVIGNNQQKIFDNRTAKRVKGEKGTHTHVFVPNKLPA